MFKNEILENERRRKIYALIEANPSVHLRELQRMTDMPLATLEYHLDYMLRKKVVFAESDAYHKRYYTKPVDAADKKILCSLRQARMREIILIVLANTKPKYQFLSDCMKIPHSTLSFYLKHLIDDNILAKERIGYDTFYTVRDEDRIVRLLVAYKSSFLDKIVDRTLKTWMETRFRSEPENAQAT